MPRPNAQWQKKYGNHQSPKQGACVISLDDTAYSASIKLSKGNREAQAIILQMMRQTDAGPMRLLDMDDMHMYGKRIILAYTQWAKHDYEKLVKGLLDRDPSLIRLINSASDM